MERRSNTNPGNPVSEYPRSEWIEELARLMNRRGEDSEKIKYRTDAADYLVAGADDQIARSGGGRVGQPSSVPPTISKMPVCSPPL